MRFKKNGFYLYSLQKKVSDEIKLSLTVDDFKKYFKSKQERTASSLSGRHMGHYKIVLECIRHQSFSLPELIIHIAQISLITASPLDRWYHASQVMLEKGKGQFVEHLRIIQLCEAYFNFVLHTIWGVLNKLLCLDLS